MYISLQEWLLMHALCKAIFQQIKEQPMHETGGTKEVKHKDIWKLLKTTSTRHIKGRSPSNGKLSDFSFYIDSQKSVHRKFKK